MIRPGRNILICMVLVCLLGGIFWFFHAGPTSGEKSTDAQKGAPGPVASVRVAPLQKSTITTAVSAYGEVVPAPGAIQVVSVPYESRVHRIMVSSGQKISIHDDLLEIGPSPNASLQLERARNDFATSQQSLTHVKQLFALKMATNTQLLQAKQAFQQARLRLESMQRQGIDGERTIRAGVSGLVSEVAVQEGVIVPAGNPLMDIVAQDRLEVRLNLEPADISRLHPGQSVALTYVNVPATEGAVGTIRRISRAVNPSTRLVDVFVTLPRSSKYLLGEYVQGRITVASAEGFVVPREAVLPEGGHHVLFTVSRGRAVRHVVQTGLENAGGIVVSAPDLKPGEQVVVLGNYELQDGMAVRVETSP